MKIKKGIVISLAVLGTLLIFSGTLLLVLNSMNEEAKTKQEVKDELVNNYKKFKEEADRFADIKKEYNKVVVADLFNESVLDDYNIWNEELNKYKSYVDIVRERSSAIAPYCENKKYTEEELNEHCKSYLGNYELIMNTFVRDVEEYNSFIDEYNSYVTLTVVTVADKEGKEVTLTPVVGFTLDSNIYQLIDANEDGTLK